MKGALGTLKLNPLRAVLHGISQNALRINPIFRKYDAVKPEADIEDPSKSEIFKRYPKILAIHRVLYFVCDTLRMFVGGGMSRFELDELMELDRAVRHTETNAPVARRAGWQTVAGSGHCGGGAWGGDHDGRVGCARSEQKPGRGSDKHVGQPAKHDVARNDSPLQVSKSGRSRDCDSDSYISIGVEEANVRSPDQFTSACPEQLRAAPAGGALDGHPGIL